MEKTKESKERRFKILKKINSDSYDNKLTSVSDLEKSLKLNTNEIFPETKHLEDLKCLDRTVRGEGNPIWNITGKAKSSMEKNPKNYDEFLQYFEGKPQLSNDMTMNSPNDRNWLLRFQWTKKTLGYVFGGGGIIAVISMLILFSSYPNIQVYMYETDDTIVKNDNSYGKQNVRIVVTEKDNRYDGWSEICFLVKNEGQDIGPNSLTANNMKIHVSTDVSCKDCENYNDIGLLKPQQRLDICDEIKISQDIENFNFEINSEYNAIWYHPPEKNVYNCNFVEKIEYDLANTWDYAYTCSLEE